VAEIPLHLRAEAIVNADLKNQCAVVGERLPRRDNLAFQSGAVEKRSRSLLNSKSIP
jgi:hypothetical protein